MKQERILSFMQARTLNKNEIEAINGSGSLSQPTMYTTYASPNGVDSIIDV